MAHDDDDDRKRFEEERRREAETARRLERNLLNALTDWILQVARPIVRKALDTRALMARTRRAWEQMDAERRERN